MKKDDIHSIRRPKHNTRQVLSSQSRQQEEDSLQDEYITIPISKKIAALAVLVVFLGIVLVVIWLRPAVFGLDIPRVERMALRLREVPLVGEYVPARYLPTEYILRQVIPQNGFQTKIVFGDVVVKMVEAGVIDRQKIETLYNSGDGVPKEMQELLTTPSNTPLRVTDDNSWWLVNLLWPIGLSNKMAVNERGPLAGEDLGNFASTGGWTLGKEAEGGGYYNSLELIRLTPEQEKRVRAIAETIYRPCCNNSTFFQDCNHGSAALGLIELGVAQGLSDEEIYKTVLAFNTYWFPRTYAATAVYFQKVRNLEWQKIDPEIILSKEYSSLSGWLANVDTPLQKMPNILPGVENVGSCSA